MEIRPKRWELWRHVIGVVACIAIGWASIAQGLRIPLLADATYGFHEFGHLATWFLPEVYRAMMGSLFQVLIPVGLAAYFLLFQRDLLAVSLMLAWAGVSANDTGRYIGDAVAQAIQISPYHLGHDWAYALTELGRIGASDELAWLVQAAALVCIFVAVGVASVGAVRAVFEYQRLREIDSCLDGPPELDQYGYADWSRGISETPGQERLPL